MPSFPLGTAGSGHPWECQAALLDSPANVGLGAEKLTEGQKGPPGQCVFRGSFLPDWGAILSWATGGQSGLFTASAAMGMRWLGGEGGPDGWAWLDRHRIRTGSLNIGISWGDSPLLWHACVRTHTYPHPCWEAANCAWALGGPSHHSDRGDFYKPFSFPTVLSNLEAPLRGTEF